MKIKNLLTCFLLLFSLNSFAQSQEEIKAAIKANPSLLNTKQAQTEMNKRGLSKDEILNKITHEEDEVEKENKKLVFNDINVSEEDVVNFDTKENNDIKNKLLNNPLYYEENFEILSKIKDTQLLKTESKLERFNTVFFKNRNVLDFSNLPIPPFYEINTGDKISIWIYGAKNQSYDLVVSSDGKVSIPQIGPISVKGLNLKSLQKAINLKLNASFKNSEIVVNISALSTIQVNLLGFVNAPGVYNLSSISTVKDLLIIAGGVKENGSIREIVIKRDGKVFKKLDFYKLILESNNDVDIVLKSGDMIYVSKSQKLIKIDGNIAKSAIYELKYDEGFNDLLNFSGGLKSDASKYGIRLKRYSNNKQIKILEFDIYESKNMDLLDGDDIYIYSIDENSVDSVKMLGNVVKPGMIQLNESKSLQELINSEVFKNGLDRVFLKHTLFDYAIVKRINQNLESEFISFNLQKLLDKKIDIKLQKNDEIYIFNKLDSNLNPFVTIEGNQVLKPGKYQYIKGMNISDLIKIAGIKQTFTHVKITSFDDKSSLPINITLQKNQLSDYDVRPFDEVYLFDSFNENNIKTISINGEVIEPGDFFYKENMRLSDLISLAGGLNSKAYKGDCEIVRYQVIDNIRESKLIKVDLGTNIDFVLKPYDEVFIKKIPFWNKKRTVSVQGEVLFPGEYIIEDDDRLIDVIKRAGGYTKNAFLKGAVFTREKIKIMQKQNMEESIAKLKQKLLTLSMQPASVGEGSKATTQDIVTLIDTLEKDALKYTPLGRISINLEQDYKSFLNSSSNLRLEDKDTITIPSINETVLVLGEVMNSTAIIYDDDNVKSYIKNAGGLTQMADDEKIYIVHSNGSSTQVDFGWFSDSGTYIEKGDVIVVPQELVTYSGLQIAKDISSILYQFALTAAAMHTVGAI